MVDIGAISRKTVGRSSVYEIPNDSILYRDMLKPIFEKEAGLLDELVDMLCRGVRKSIASIYVFGSVARGSDNPASDVDVVLILEPGAEKKEIEEIVGENEREIYRLFRKGTNTLAYTSEEFSRMKKRNHPLAREILSEGVLLFGKEQ